MAQVWGQMCYAWYTTRGGNGSRSGQAVKAAAADSQVAPTSTPAEHDSGPAVEQKRKAMQVVGGRYITTHLLSTYCVLCSKGCYGRRLRYSPRLKELPLLAVAAAAIITHLIWTRSVQVRDPGALLC